MSMRGRTLFTSVSTLVMLATAIQAQAQTTGAASDAPKPEGQGKSVIEDIVVTATRQATNLQDTPIAITAVTAEALGQRGITSVADLTSVVPNAQFRRVQGAFGPGVSSFIRGIGSGDTSLGGEAAVAYYIDDVYYPLLLGANFDLLDVDHIEVLRGPQGTLFGRNSLAGAVNIVGKQPSTAETTGYAEVTAGSWNRRDVRAGLNLPLGENAAVMVSGLSKQREGYQKRLDFTCEMNRRGTPQLAGSYPSNDPLVTSSPNYKPSSCEVGRLGGEDVTAGRVSFLWKPTSDVKITLNTDYIRDLSENAADTVVDVDPTRANSNVKSEAAYYGLTVDNRFVTGDPYTTYVTYADRIPAGTVIPGNTYYNGTVVNGRPTRGGYNLSPHIDLTSWGASGKLAWDLGNDIDLTAVVGYRSLQEVHAFDTDGTPLVIEHTVNDIRNDYLTTEVRLSGTSKLMDWVGGAFYFDAQGTQHAAVISPSAGAQRLIYSTFDPTSKAVFANATIRPFGEQFSFVVGGRYSEDKKIVNFTNLVDTSPSASDIRFLVVPEQEKYSWKLGANYQLNYATLFYASAASGNSLPGYNPRPAQPSQVSQFDGNDDVAYELGAKFDLFDGYLRLNSAVFYTDFTNRPTSITGAEATLNASNQPVAGNQQLIALPGGPPGSTLCSTQTLPTNTGILCIGRTYYRNQPANVRGVELEYTITPLGAMLINGSVGWSEFRAPDISARTVNKRQNNPAWTANAGVQYEFDTAAIGGTITPRLDWTYEGSQIVSGTSTKYNYLMPARSVVNGRIAYDNTANAFTVALGVTNLFDKFYYLNAFDYQAIGFPQTDAQPARPREWYLTLKKEF
ncbi:MAG: TonB-dependent receptor [Steroidobacteraceae bacterium]